MHYSLVLIFLWKEHVGSLIEVLSFEIISGHCHLLSMCGVWSMVLLSQFSNSRYVLPHFSNRYLVIPPIQGGSPMVMLVYAQVHHPYYYNSYIISFLVLVHGSWSHVLLVHGSCSWIMVSWFLLLVHSLCSSFVLVLFIHCFC
jgi:hypothetical protein